MQLLQDGLLLMLIGMGTVFAFLAIMVATILVSARVLRPFTHLLPEPVAARKRTRGGDRPGPVEDETLVAVIAAAIHRYRAERR